MSEEYQLAFSLMVIGMVTVFLILTLVVTSGKLLIAVSNRFSKDEESPVVSGGEDEDIPVAIISAVVQHITSGKGQITDIKKV